MRSPAQLAFMHKLAGLAERVSIHVGPTYASASARRATGSPRGGLLMFARTAPPEFAAQDGLHHITLSHAAGEG